MTWLLLVLALAGPARPDPQRTPGVVRPLSHRVICGTKWGRDKRFITEKMKRHVAAAYGVPWAKRAEYEFDHLVPRALGGADKERNLWPQPLGDARHVKDPLEVRVWKLVCAGDVSLADAQQAFMDDWVSASERWPRATSPAR